MKKYSKIITIFVLTILNTSINVETGSVTFLDTETIVLDGFSNIYDYRTLDDIEYNGEFLISLTSKDTSKTDIIYTYGISGFNIINAYSSRVTYANYQNQSIKVTASGTLEPGQSDIIYHRQLVCEPDGSYALIMDFFTVENKSAEIDLSISIYEKGENTCSGHLWNPIWNNNGGSPIIIGISAGIIIVLLLLIRKIIHFLTL